MQANRYHLIGILAILGLALLMLPHAALAANAAQEFPHVVQFELGDQEFASGDSIAIRELRGTSDVVTTGETYCVTGSYTLSSQAEADLSFFATTTNRNSTPIDPKQTVRIKKGSGSFRLIKTMTDDGYLHLTFYSNSSGNSFGGVYFGQGQWVLHDKHFSHLAGPPRPAGHSSSSHGSTSGNGVSSSGPNKVLFDFLGDPVEPPASLDPAYSKAGLAEAMATATRNAGISLKRVEIDDSEFPFLIGFLCEPGDKAKVIEQIGKMKSYATSGGVGSHEYYAMNIVPYSAFPPEAGQRIYRRLTLREAVLCDKLNSGQ